MELIEGVMVSTRIMKFKDRMLWKHEIWQKRQKFEGEARNLRFDKFK